MEKAAFLFGITIISVPPCNISLLTIPLVSSVVFWGFVLFKNIPPCQEVFQKRDTSRSGKLDLMELHAAVQETGEPTAYLGKSHPLPHKGWEKPRAGKHLENCR